MLRTYVLVIQARYARLYFSWRRHTDARGGWLFAILNLATKPVADFM